MSEKIHDWEIPRRVRDLTGQRFHWLEVIEWFGCNPRNEAIWQVKCRCGTYKVVRGVDLTKGEIKSCGCWRSYRMTRAGRKARREGREEVGEIGEGEPRA
jgi:hypothetical protein